MRLIDADELKRQIENALKKQKARGCDLVKVSELPVLIDRQETAYDVEKVVEQLNETRWIFESRNIVPLINMDKAIEIVKDGGLSKK